MKITRFTGKAVNGYLNFNLEFLDRLTFVTGINGSGKTSAMNCMAALLLPRFDYLESVTFDEIAVHLEIKGKTVRLLAKQREDSTDITCSRFSKQKLVLPRFRDSAAVASLRNREYEEGLYREVLASNANNPVLDFLESLPTPMYLGLNRRAVSMDDGLQRYDRRPSAQRRTRRQLFGRSLEEGIAQALKFAQERFQDDRRAVLALDQEFREQLVLALIDIPPISFTGPLDPPSTNEFATLQRARANLERLPTLLNLEADRVASKINPLFEFLDETVEKVQASDKNTSEPSVDEITALVNWSFNKANVDKIMIVSDMISDYNSKVQAIEDRTNSFVTTVDSFLRDSGKTIKFEPNGELRFTVGDEDEGRLISTLSSGELQLVVILTHLYFNPEVGQANVLIIDEPELSLHVQWQEKFVDGIMEASSNAQFILATHSPSIILDKTSYCIEIVQQ